MSKVLVVDDEELFRIMISEILSAEGFEVIVAEDGEEAIEIASASFPDLILMDMNMPKMTGFQAIRTLKEKDETKNTPIVAVTAHDTTGDYEEAYDAGCDGYLSKPLDAVLLIEKVKELVSDAS